MRVILAVYDLSGGMAAGLSQQFLGTQIDLVPHTGVILCHPNSGGDWEYFFGGGIQKMRPQAFRMGHGIQPVQLMQMGETTQTVDGVSSWVTQNAHRFTMGTYDLLAHNCNNFSDAFLRECLSLPGVAQEILDVPRRFIQSPMGSMIAPMISGMYQPFSQASADAPPPPLAVNHAAPPLPSTGGLDFSALLSASFPSPVAPAPPPPSTPSQDYAAQLSELHLMGFEDDVRNLDALNRAKGDLGLAIDYISGAHT